MSLTKKKYISIAVTLAASLTVSGIGFVILHFLRVLFDYVIGDSSLLSAGFFVAHLALGWHSWTLASPVTRRFDAWLYREDLMHVVTILTVVVAPKIQPQHTALQAQIGIILNAVTERRAITAVHLLLKLERSHPWLFEEIYNG